MPLGAAWLGPATAPLGQWRDSVLCGQVVIVAVAQAPVTICVYSETPEAPKLASPE